MTSQKVGSHGTIIQQQRQKLLEIIRKRESSSRQKDLKNVNIAEIINFYILIIKTGRSRNA